MATPNLLKRQFNRDGYLVLKNVFSKKMSETIVSEANKLYNLPEVKGGYMKYFEKKTDTQTGTDTKILARMEYFINEEKLSELKKIVDNEVTPILEEVLESRVALFKDKINWKLPGGGAFKPHQDFEAWEDLPPKYYVTCAIFVDECTVENGCLEMVSEKHTEGVLENTNGCINKDVVDSMEWRPILGDSRDLVIFDAFVPHRSGPNLSNSPRRVYYFTYNLLKDGNYYEDYFTKKRAEFPPDIERDENTQLNLNSKYNLANPIK